MISHIAIWVKDIELMKDFYTRYFKCSANNKYHNPQKEFSSYFLKFETGCAIELMHQPDVVSYHEKPKTGYAHIAFSVGSKTEVDKLTEKLHNDGYVTTPPRQTGDGFYESAVLDPERNLIEITV